MSLDGGPDLVSGGALVERGRAAALQVRKLFVSPLVDGDELLGFGFLILAHSRRLPFQCTEPQ